MVQERILYEPRLEGGGGGGGGGGVEYERRRLTSKYPFLANQRGKARPESEGCDYRLGCVLGLVGVTGPIIQYN